MKERRRQAREGEIASKRDALYQETYESAGKTLRRSPTRATEELLGGRAYILTTPRSRWGDAIIYIDDRPRSYWGALS